MTPSHHPSRDRLGQGQGFYDARSEPLDKFVVPILDEGAGTNDNDTFAGACLVGSDARLE